MRWQRPLRYGIGVAGLAFAAFLYSRYEKKPPVVPAPAPPPLATGVSYESAMSPGAEQVRYKNNKEVSKFSYARMAQFTDGRQVMDKPVFIADREGKPYRVTADKAEVKSPNGAATSNETFEEVHLTGNVVLHEDDGMEIKADEATYRDSVAILDIPGAMSFNDGQTSGNAVGATYERNQQLLTLRDQAVIHMAADKNGQGKFDANARSMTINRTTHFVSMDGNATIAREHETINAETAQLHMNEDNHGVQMMELHQHASIAPAGGAKTPEMHGDDITLELQADGRTIKRTQMMRSASMTLTTDTGRQSIYADMIDTELAADGQTVTSLRGTGGTKVALPLSKDSPAREITSKELTGKGEAKKGLTDLVFQGGVEFIETKPATKTDSARRRKVVATQLALKLDAGDLSNISEATFRGGVEFIDGVKYGEGSDEMVYRPAKGRLELRKTGTTGKKQLVQTDKIRVLAKTIDIDLDKTGIKASGELSTETIPDPKKGKSGLFDESKVTNGKATSLSYDGDAGLAIYTGPARLWQGSGKDQSRIDAEKQITLDDAKGDIAAEGKVSTIFPISNMQAGTSGSSTASAQKFSYSNSDHRAKYTGTAADRALLNGPDGKFYGQSIDLWLSDDGQELKKMVILNDLQARVSAQRTVLARVDPARPAQAIGRMEYDAKSGVYTITGSPAKVIERAVDKGAESCTVSQGSVLTFTKTQSGKEQGTFAWSDPVGVGSITYRATNCADWVIK